MLVSPEIGLVFTGSMDVNWTNSHDVPTNASMNADVEKKNGRKNKYFGSTMVLGRYFFCDN